MEQPNHHHRHHLKNSSSQSPPTMYFILSSRTPTKTPRCGPDILDVLEETIVIVTGANKGIGFSLVKKLSQSGVTVILTCRNTERGIKAVETLREEGILVRFRRLYISDASSIDSFVAWLERSFGALDILVNNAALSFNEVNGNSVDDAETVIDTNYRGTKRLTQALLPYFCRSSTVSRILNVTSRLGHVNKLKNPRFVAMSRGENVLEVQIDGMVSSFLADVKDGTWKDKGWPEVWTDYEVSKLALNSYSKILAKRNVGFELSIICYCPGFTRTTMTGGVGKRTADEAAETIAMLVLVPPQELPTGPVFFTGCDPVVKSRL